MLPCCQEKKIKIACEQAHAQAQAHSFLYCRAQAQAQAQDRWQAHDPRRKKNLTSGNFSCLINL